jgi:hypothetical protein
MRNMHVEGLIQHHNDLGPSSAKAGVCSCQTASHPQPLAISKCGRSVAISVVYVAAGNALTQAVSPAS